MKADATQATPSVDTRHTRLIRLARGAGSADANVVFDSRGVVLVVGDDASVVTHAASLASSLKVVLCAPGAENSPGLPRSVTSLGGRIVSITGRMGAFSARAATSRDESTDIGAFSGNPDRTFDLVLDLGRTPKFAQPAPPLGYFAPGRNSDAIADALAILPTLVGRFAKPRHFDYAAELCTHGAQGVVGCTRCIDVCSTGAIASAGDRVVVDPFLCQGCATCTLACPTGALSFKSVNRADLLARCAEAISAARDNGIPHPVLVVRETPARGEGDLPALPHFARLLDVPVLAAFGDELWFAALAQGAAGVVILVDDALVSLTRELLEKRVALAREVLGAAGTRADRISLAVREDAATVITAAASAAHRGARTAVPNPRATKRALTLAAIDTLTSGVAAGAHSLRPDASFGDVVVDRSKCTVCRACVNLCPTEALIGAAEPRATLSFVEARCVQCGLCEAGCPEKAISLQPRFVADAVTRNAARVLHEEDLVRCMSCGTPFIAASLLAASLERMRDFPGLTSIGGIERLKLCPPCRQRESLNAAG